MLLVELQVQLKDIVNDKKKHILCLVVLEIIKSYRGWLLNSHRAAIRTIANFTSRTCFYTVYDIDLHVSPVSVIGIDLF